MSIIKKSFEEGRNTTVSWDESEAKKNELKLEVYLNNSDSFIEKNIMAPISLVMIDPDTGDKVASFPNRLVAAEYIANVILNRPDKKPQAITGNLEICMRAGWKSYGYYWKVSDEHVKVDMTGFDIRNGLVIYKNNRKYKTFYNYSELANIIGIDRGVLRKRILRGAKIDHDNVYKAVYHPKHTKSYKAKTPSNNTGWSV